MNYTDEEIIEIIKRKRKEKRRRKRIVKFVIILLMIPSLVYVGFLLYSEGSIFFSDLYSKMTSKRGTIFIDAAHGGMDPGSEADGHQEKTETLELAKLVKKELEAQDFKVVLSRTTDKDVDRTKRGQMANDAKADLFVSLHKNQSNDSTGKGVEMWISSSNPKESRLLANNMFKEIEDVGISLNRGVRTGTLVDPNDDYLENSVPKMPSCLIEFGFLTNAEDNKLYKKNKKKYAKAIADGISKTHKELYEKDS